jgi:hypothetical protein
MLNFRNFVSMAEALAFMIRHRGEYSGMQCVIVASNKWRARVYWQ